MLDDLEAVEAAARTRFEQAAALRRFEGTHDNYGSFDMVGAVGLSTREVATLATNWDISRVIAVNDTARDYFTWGTATRRGSPIDKVRESILEGDEHQEAIDCVGVIR